MESKRYGGLVRARHQLLDKTRARLEHILERLEKCAEIVSLECESEIEGDKEFRSLTESVVNYLESCAFGGEIPVEYHEGLRDLFGYGAAFWGYDRVLKIMAEHDRLLVKESGEDEDGVILKEAAILERAASEIEKLFDDAKKDQEVGSRK